MAGGKPSKKAIIAAAKVADKALKMKQEVEDSEWDEGTKDASKQQAKALKKYEAAKAKDRRRRLLDAEEAQIPGRQKPKSVIAAEKKTPKLGDIDPDRLPVNGRNGRNANEPTARNDGLVATNIEDAIDALAEPGDSDKLDRHPERRFKAAYAAFEKRRLEEMDSDGSGKGLRQNQRKEKIRKEFEKSDENPFNKSNVQYNATSGDMRDLKQSEQRMLEERLTNN